MKSIVDDKINNFIKDYKNKSLFKIESFKNKKKYEGYIKYEIITVIPSLNNGKCFDIEFHIYNDVQFKTIIGRCKLMDVSVLNSNNTSYDINHDMNLNELIDLYDFLYNNNI